MNRKSFYYNVIKNILDESCIKEIEFLRKKKFDELPPIPLAHCSQRFSATFKGKFSLSFELLSLFLVCRYIYRRYICPAKIRSMGLKMAEWQPYLLFGIRNNCVTFHWNLNESPKLLILALSKRFSESGWVNEILFYKYWWIFQFNSMLFYWLS